MKPLSLLSVLACLVVLSVESAWAGVVSTSQQYTRDGYIKETVSVTVQPSEVKTISGVELTTDFTETLFDYDLGGGEAMPTSEDPEDELDDGEPVDGDLEEAMNPLSEEAEGQISDIMEQVREQGAGFYIGNINGTTPSADAFDITNNGTLNFTLTEGSFALLALSVADLIPYGRTIEDMCQMYLVTTPVDASGNALASENGAGISMDAYTRTTRAGFICTTDYIYVLGDPWATINELDGKSSGDALAPIGGNDPDVALYPGMGEVLTGDDDYLIYIWKADEDGGESLRLSLSNLEAIMTPEPATGTLSLLALVGLALRRRR